MTTRHRNIVPAFGRNLAGPSVRITAQSWDTPVVVGGESWRMLDGDMNTCWSTPEPAAYPVSFGVTMDRAIEIGGVDYECPYNLTTGEFVPTPDQQAIEVFRQGRWERIEAEITKAPGTRPGQVTPCQCRFRPLRVMGVRVVVKNGWRDRPDTWLVPAGENTRVNDRPLLVRQFEVVSRDLERQPNSLLWSSVNGEPRRMALCAANDGNTDTYLPLVSLEAVGYEWPEARRVSGVVARYGHFGFEEGEHIPRLQEQVLEYWDGKDWRILPAQGALDEAAWESRARYTHAGTVASVFSFEPIRCRRLRIRFTGARKRASLSSLEIYDSPAMATYMAGLHALSGKEQMTIKGREVDLGCDFPVLLGDGAQFAVVDWMKLGNVDAALVQIKGFDRRLATRRGTSVAHLTDERMDTWWSPASGGPAEIGAEWMEPVLVGRVTAVYRSHGGKRFEPAYDAQELQYWDGRRWLKVDVLPELDESTVDKGYTTWNYQFFPTAASRFRLMIIRMHASCSREDTVALIKLAMIEEVPRGHKDWLCSWRPDPYGQWLKHGGKEPTYESVSAHVLSPIMRAPIGFRSVATLGHVRETAESAVSWEGTVLTPWPYRLGGGFRSRGKVNWFVGFAFGSKPRLMGVPHRAIRRRLMDGYLPGVEYTHYHEGLVYREEVFATEVGNEGIKGKIANCIRVTVENPGKTARKTNVVVVTGCHLAYPDRPAPIPCRYDRKRRWVKDAYGRLLLWHSAGGRFQDGLEKTIAYTLKLKPGERRAIEVRQPLFACGESDGHTLAALEWKDARAHFKRSWQSLLDSGMRVATPEQRVNDAYRACLSQLMIGDHAGVTPDGLWPSHYYWATLGFEDNWNAQAFACCGHGAAAKGIYDKCLFPLNAFARKYRADYLVTIFNSNGLVPYSAIKVGRWAHDPQWLSRIRPFLKECAEWTRAERQKTARDSGLHAGLLPRHIYGGDIRDPCYSFVFNVLLWRGLRDTGYLLKNFGEEPLAETYLREAQAWRELIVRLMRDLRFTRQKPTSVPLKMYWKMPYDLSPTHYQLILPETVLELGLVPPKEAEEYADYLVANGRLMCGVQKLFTSAILEPNKPIQYVATVESQYNWGYQWAYLNRDRIEDYILGFYGLMTLTMDRDVFTTGEQNELGVTEHDRFSNGKAEGKRRDTMWVEANDPDTNPPANWLLMLRHMLVMEEEDDNGRPTGVLWLNRAAPRGWFEDGERLAVENAPVFGGAVSWRVESRTAKGRISAEVDCSMLEENQTVHLRLRHPDRSPMKSVRIDGKVVNSFDARREIVTFRSSGVRHVIDVWY